MNVNDLGQVPLVRSKYYVRPIRWDFNRFYPDVEENLIRCWDMQWNEDWSAKAGKLLLEPEYQVKDELKLVQDAVEQNLPQSSTQLIITASETGTQIVPRHRFEKPLNMSVDPNRPSVEQQRTGSISVQRTGLLQKQAQPQPQQQQQKRSSGRIAGMPGPFGLAELEA
jgi:hypothetical protein